MRIEEFEKITGQIHCSYNDLSGTSGWSSKRRVRDITMGYFMYQFTKFMLRLLFRVT